MIYLDKRKEEKKCHLPLLPIKPAPGAASEAPAATEESGRA